MVAKRLSLLSLSLVVMWACAVAAQEQPAAATPPSGTATETELDKQLNIYKSTLFEGKTEQIRIDAATVMLFSDSPAARQILLEALDQTENVAARTAVCKALSFARTGQRPVRDKEQFIRPLLLVLASTDSATARLGADATLLFGYEEVGGPLAKLIADANLPLPSRLNAVYALELHPDMRAAITLLELVDDPVTAIASAAREALNSLGIDSGKDKLARQRTTEQLRSEGQEVYLRKQVIRQRSQIRLVRTESNNWLIRYLSAQEQILESLADDTAKGAFLAQHLATPEPAVKLWALEKVRQLRLASKTSTKLAVDVGPAVVNLVSDQDRNVRLKTAQLLSLMGQVNSAERLLSQLEIEQDEEVKTEVFAALGGACYFAFLPSSPFKVPPEVRVQTLDWAVRYLAQEDRPRAQKGAEVMKKLLEQNGLTDADAGGYLALLAERYKQEKGKPEGALRAELLASMAGLCAQGVHSSQASKMFGPLFEEALAEREDRVREEAVDGLIYINKAGALKRMKRDFVNDNSLRVRRRLIDLAAEVGGKDDLAWLADKIGSNAESESAWQAMLKILDGSDTAVFVEWIDKLAPREGNSRLAAEQQIAFLETAERKAASGGTTEFAKRVNETLANLYVKVGQFEKAASYLSKLRENAATAEQKEMVLRALLDVYLIWPKPDLAAKLIGNCLQEKDLDSNSPLVQAIDSYFTKPPSAADASAVCQALAAIRPAFERPKWQKCVEGWSAKLSVVGSADAPKQPGT